MVDGQDFGRSMRCGVKCGNGLLTIAIAVPDEGAAISVSPLVGFTISKREIPLAVDRNRVKRRLRHLMRERLDRLPSGSKVVVLARSRASSASYTCLAKAVDELLGRAIEKLGDK
ncbi:ribonuclease P protein component [Scrofimicrobium canadense]